MKNLIEQIKKLSLPVKIQLVIALISTAAIPVYAWFSYQDKIEAMSKIKEPPSINLASGGDDPALYINLENIDVSSGTEKFIVFSVEPGKYSAYDIQLSHTTNIPFTYELYRVMEDKLGTIGYTDHTRNVDPETEENVETELHYSIMTGYSYTPTGTNTPTVTAGKVNLVNVNPDNGASGRTLGNETTLAAKKRSNYDTKLDYVNQYVKPLYSIARKIPKIDSDGNEDRDYFAIKLTWQINTTIQEGNAQYWNYAFNNKETDIIYISAKQNTYTEE